MGKNGKVDRKSFIDIDMELIDEEWTDQPKLMFKHGERLAYRKFDVAEAKAAFELCEAKLSLRIRKNPDKYGLKRATDKSVEAAVTCHPLYQEALKALNKATLTANLQQAGVVALDHRRTALSNVVDLIGMQIVATPKASRLNKEEMKRVSEEVRMRRVNKALTYKADE